MTNDEVATTIKAPGNTVKSEDGQYFITYSPYDNSVWGWHAFDRYSNAGASTIIAPDVIWRNWYIQDGRRLDEDRDPHTAPNVAVGGLRYEALQKWLREHRGAPERQVERPQFTARKSLAEFRSPSHHPQE
jgi:hypothetical protein